MWNTVPVNGSDLKATLQEIGISQSDLARLLHVTPRAVALWMADDREISGPAESYLQLLSHLPANLRQAELNRLKEKGTSMRDGFFGITFQGQQGAGVGVLVFDTGKVFGTDTEGTRYDGGYTFEERSSLATIKLKVTFPPNVMSVFGIANPYEWAIDVTTTMNPKQNSGAVAVQTSVGQTLKAQYKFLRPLPATE